MKNVATIDFETLPIQKRPDYPPKPVGMAFNINGKKDEYLAWGHPTENNCTKVQAARRLKQLYNEYTIVTHNGKFDLEVAEKWFGLPLEPKHGWHDSMLLAFLHDPREPNLKLKPLADKHLSLKPDEQTKLKDWILANVPGAKKSKTKWAQYIYLAPGSLVGHYAKGDTKRTYRLADRFYKYVRRMGMLEQYDLEKWTVLKAIDMERQGIPIDYKALEPDLEKAKRVHQRAERAIQRVLGDINLNSGPQKVEAFERLGLVSHWEYGEPSKKTKQINPKTGIDSLMRVCTDKKLVKNLEIYSKYSKLIGTYMQPWLDSALENNGLFFPWFNTIKGDNDKGTYTGRFSSNFQQVPRRPKDVFKGMPFLRNYVMPDKGQLLFDRDFASQEIRILAHFEDGELLAAFLANPELDVHQHVMEIMLEMTGIKYDRSDHVKPCNFLVIYGGGAPALSRNIKVPFEEAQSILSAHEGALPGVLELKDDLKKMARHGEMFRTAGGRWYNFEHGKEYVGLNTLIQGSAADHTKRALRNIDRVISDYHARIMLTVHDEFLISGPRRQKNQFMKDFREAMEYDTLFDLPMLTDGKIGERWGQMVKVK